MKRQQTSAPSERVSFSSKIRFDTGEPLPSQTKAWLIQTGVVKTYTWNERGEAIILGYWGKGELVGPCLSVIRPYQMQCRTPVVAQPVMPQDFSQLADVLSHHCQQKEQLLLINRCEPLQERLRLFLNWLASRLGEPVEHGWHISFKLTHQELAEAVRSSRVSVTRTLQRLEQQGYLQRYHRGWRIWNTCVDSISVASLKSSTA